MIFPPEKSQASAVPGVAQVWHRSYREGDLHHGSVRLAIGHGQ